MFSFLNKLPDQMLEKYNQQIAFLRLQFRQLRHIQLQIQRFLAQLTAY
jgi:hypothetical protein